MIGLDALAPEMRLRPPLMKRQDDESRSEIEQILANSKHGSIDSASTKVSVISES